VTGCDELDDSIPYVETHRSLAQYIGDMRAHNETRIDLILRAGPLEAYRIAGYTGHVIAVNPHPDCDHSAEEQALMDRLGAWRPFVAFYNTAEEWEITHFEPVDEARPLQETC
jgi:hypothetical protein